MTTPQTITISSPANARVNSDGIRRYQWQGHDLLSVTSAFKRAGMPHALHQWALSRVIERAVGEADTLNAMLTRPRRPRERVLEKNRVKEASAWLRVAATEERDRRAAIGSAVHDAIAEGLHPDSIPGVIEAQKDGKEQVIDGLEVRSRLAQFLDWRRASGAELVASEFQVFNLAVGYGGSADFIARFPSGRRVLIDTKTGDSVFAEHVLQVEGYRGGEFVGRDDVVDGPLTDLLHSGLGLGILHLAPDHWEYLALREDPTAWPAFVGAVTYARWLDAHPSVDGCVAGSRTNRVSEAMVAAAAAEIAEMEAAA